MNATDRFNELHSKLMNIQKHERTQRIMDWFEEQCKTLKIVEQTYLANNRITIVFNEVDLKNSIIAETYQNFGLNDFKRALYNKYGEGNVVIKEGDYNGELSHMIIDIWNPS
jgi:L-fucose isomerase-like protein